MNQKFLAIVFIASLFVFLFLVVYFLIGLKTIVGLSIYFALLMGLLLLSGIVRRGLMRTAERIAFKKAPTAELEREDDFLLQAVGFSQAVLFIYLNLIPSSGVIDLFKVVIPISTSAFFGLRGYAKIKNSARYRYYSMYAFALVISMTLGSLLAVLSPSLYIEEQDVSNSLLLPIYLLILEVPRGFFQVFCSKRYGYPK